MIPLGTGEIPTSGAEMAQRIAAALGAMIQAKGGALPNVECEMATPERVQRIVIDLTNVESAAAKMQRPGAFTRLGGAVIDSFALGGDPVILHGAPVKLATTGKHLPMSWSRDDHGNLWFVPAKDQDQADNASGTMEVSAETAQIEAAAKKVFADLAETQGAKLKDLRLQIESAGPRSLLVKADVAASKFMMTAKLQALAELVLDDQMNLRISQLDVKGDGGAGSLVANMLDDKLAAARGREFALGQFMFAGAALEDVHVEVDSRVRLVAKFG